MQTRYLLTFAALATVLLQATAMEIWEGDNCFSVNAALGYNIKLSSKNLQAPAPNPGPATGPQVDRFYDNGFVRLDVSDNAGGHTTYWGFDSALGATYDGLPGGGVTMSSTRSVAQGETFHSQDDPQSGPEFGYARRLFRFGDGDKPWLIVGLEARCSFLDLAITDTSVIAGNAITTDTYQLAPGNVVLGGSYEGSFLGDPPGPLLGSEPTDRTLTPGTASLAHRLRGHMYGFNIGPTLEFPFCKSALLSVSGGWALTGVDAEDYFQETVAVGAGPLVPTEGSSRFDSWHGGWYARGALSVALGEQWQAQAGVQWRDTGTLTDSDGRYENRLDLSNAFLVTFGLGFSF